MQAAGTPTGTSNAVESSQTSGFDRNGPVSSPAVGPTNGSFLALVSNGTSGGDGTLTGSSVSQTFTLPADATTITLNVMLLNNDDPTDFASFDDFGGVALTQGATVIAQHNLDLDPASSANQHVTAAANRAGFLNSTAFVPVTFNVAAFAGQSVTITAYSLQYGSDNDVETRLLVDDIRVNAGAVPPVATAIPTLSTTLLWGLGLLVVATAFAFRRARSRG